MKVCRHCKTEKEGMYLQVQKRKYKKRTYSYEYFVCRECNTKNCKRYRKTPAGKLKSYEMSVRFSSRNPHKRSAWMKAQQVKRLPCEVCGAKNTHRHHPNYSKPLEVVHLCPLHHKHVHKLAINKV